MKVHEGLHSLSIRDLVLWHSDSSLTKNTSLVDQIITYANSHQVDHLFRYSLLQFNFTVKVVQLIDLDCYFIC